MFRLPLGIWKGCTRGAFGYEFDLIFRVSFSKLACNKTYMNTIVIIATLVVLAFTRIYLVIPKRSKIFITNKNKRTKPCKTCVFLGSGNANRQLYKQFTQLKH